MSKKKHNSKRNKIDTEKKLLVLSAMSFILDKEIEEQRRQIAKEKARKVLGWLTVAGAIILVSLSIINTFKFDISWALDIRRWYSNLYISLMVYIFITDVVLILERYFKMDQKPIFGYIWPFIAFLISLFISNTMSVEIMRGEPRTTITIFFIDLFPSIIMMSSSIKIGKDKASKEINLIEKASRIIEDNPDVVQEITEEYDEFIDKNNNC